VNPRLQVEQASTTLTDFDLVKRRFASRGERLPTEARRARLVRSRCALRGGSGLRCRAPAASLLDLRRAGVRVDAGIAAGGTIPSEFDSMIAKILARGATREEARARLVRAVSDARVVVEGGMTNKGFLLDVLEHPEFRRGGITTNWLDGTGLAAAPKPAIEALIVAAIETYQLERQKVRANFFAAAGRGRPREIPPSSGAEFDLVYAGESYRLRLFAIGGWTCACHTGRASRRSRCSSRDRTRVCS
jgi:acetyl/propionyl-CoA carboxylase alpha subunit